MTPPIYLKFLFREINKLNLKIHPPSVAARLGLVSHPLFKADSVEGPSLTKPKMPFHRDAGKKSDSHKLELENVRKRMKEFKRKLGRGEGLTKEEILRGVKEFWI